MAKGNVPRATLAGSCLGELEVQAFDAVEVDPMVQVDAVPIL